MASFEVAYKGQLMTWSRYNDTDTMILMVIDWAWNKWIFEKSLMAWRQLIWRAMLLMAHCSDELFVTRYNVKCYCYCFVVIAIIVLFCSVLFCFAIVRAFCYFIASPHHCTPVRVGILQNKHCSRNFWGSFDCAEHIYRKRIMQCQFLQYDTVQTLS